MKHKFNKHIILIFLFCFLLGNNVHAFESHVSEIFLKRHSGKAFEANRPVTREQILALIEATRWSPSSHNDQPWNFIICDKNLTPEAYHVAFNSFKGTQQNWVQNVPLLIVVVTRTKELYKGKFNEWAEYDTGASVMSLSLQATDLGLMVHQIGGFDKQQIIQGFKLTNDYKPMTIIAVGYENNEPEPNAKPRDRRPIGDNFFLGEWGQSFK